MTAEPRDGHFDIAGDSERRVIRITHTGPFDLALARAARPDAALLAEHTGFRVVVMDLREAEIRLSTTDHYQFHREHITAFPRGTRMAYVCTSDQFIEMMGNATFVETVAKNHGFTIKGFDSIDEADAWADRFASQLAVAVKHA